ncbi:hypothetical protein [Rhodococcus sp. AQ5-07]|uniref:hypothetical protein n=1 Tax=Rhodococcus sp. AQ5-07 TaxID=2054902 RepID=UPI000DC0173E|nr:hypothetical protein [Rhodococcus sp. AQ5-07]RAL31162.1 hypothetical protein CVN56_29785 [Rhodococcus sp. AQ5-07]
MLFVVMGPPAAGKSTWCHKNAKPGDIVIDFDVLAVALTAGHSGSHEHSMATKMVTKAARQAAIDRAITLTDCDVYLIHSTPSASLLAKYRAIGATVVTIDPGEAITMARAKAERPWRSQQVAKRYYRGSTATQAPDTASRKPSTSKPPTPKVSPRKRGLGAAHEAQRKRLLEALLPGSPCWWCLGPMYREAARNPDGAVLAADHTLARAHGGMVADRLLHSRCNSSRGDGSRDHLRPALGITAGQRPTSTRDWLD